MGVKFWEDPYPVYRALHDKSDVLWDGTLEVWIVTGRDAANAVLRSAKFSSDWSLLRPGTPDPEEFPALHHALRGWFMFMDQPQHTRLRRVMQSWFARSRVESLSEDIRILVSDRIDRVRHLDRVDLMADFAGPLASGLLARVLRIPETVVTEAATQMKVLAGYLAQPHKPEHARRADAALTALTRLYQDLAPQVPPDSALSSLIGEDPHHPNAEYLSTAQLLSFAGQETTAGLIAVGLLHLMRDRSLYREVCDRRVALDPVVEELLRFDTPVPQVPRIAVDDMAVGGQRIRTGDRVIVVLAAANRDWAASDDPDLLDVAREQRHAAFGAGVHYCLGAPIARAGAVGALRSWTAAFPQARIVPGSVEWARGSGYRGLERALVRLE
ncbi:cytochrome P-450 like protein [Streptomyces lucensis JCM 4490]|uniref:Cytochrome P-450 like protein n=1 Tax=Streptomyces lucensis JCM 4490 TaxID=1306176 RepID=A0A918MX38_9ACTN|nr:cytochrome P450 [Streptomyces lucensis]GGW79603.1 cytochrome P-450 like protein [Streptomyces lucensis JCM 4490]